MDFSFTKSLEMPLDVFLKKWSVAPSFKAKYSLDEYWPEKSLVRHPRHTAGALQSLFQLELWKFGQGADRGIRPDKFIISQSEPTPKLLAFPGPAV
jgi:hypothetical protein